MVAEGVEDEASWRLLRELDCDLVQGYFLARPMPAETMTSWLAEHFAAYATRLRREATEPVAERRELGGHRSPAARPTSAASGGSEPAATRLEDVAQLRLALAQIDPVVGDLDGNAAQVLPGPGGPPSRARTWSPFPRWC